MRSGASTTTLDNIIVEAIRIDDMLYERQIEKRYILRKPTGYLPRGGTGGHTRDRGDPIELNTTIKEKPRGGKGKGNKKGGIKYYLYGKLGYIKKDYRTNKVRHPQINIIQINLVPTDTTNSARGVYLGTYDRIARANRKHACLSQTACYNDDYRVYLSDKQGLGQYPTRPRQELNVIQRKLLQQLRDGGNLRYLRSLPLIREDVTLQENQEPEILKIQPIIQLKDTIQQQRDQLRNRHLLRILFVYERPLTDLQRELSGFGLDEGDELPEQEELIEQA